MKAYQHCPLCARVTPLDLSIARCPHDGAVMLTHCSSCAAPISSPFAIRCGSCGADYQQPAPRDSLGKAITPP